ncbi:MAG TPA: hypothetical protein V6C97_35410 [Oculatellaceae cyanobacterium]
MRTLVRLWQTAVRPPLEYGAEVRGDEKWKEAERVQTAVAKRILQCSRYTADDAALGELGWRPLRARRDELRLRFFMRLEAMLPTRLAKVVYEVSAAMLEEKTEHNNAEHTHQLRPRRRTEPVPSSDGRWSGSLWMQYTTQLMRELNAGGEWRNSVALLRDAGSLTGRQTDTRYDEQ